MSQRARYRRNAFTTTAVTVVPSARALEGFRCIAIEREADYLPLIMQRLSKPLQVGLAIDFGDGGAA